MVLCFPFCLCQEKRLLLRWLAENVILMLCSYFWKFPLITVQLFNMNTNILLFPLFFRTSRIRFYKSLHWTPATQNSRSWLPMEKIKKLAFPFISVPDWEVINLQFPKYCECFLFKQETSSVGVVYCANHENTFTMCYTIAQFKGKKMYRLKQEVQMLLSTKINSGNSYLKLYMISWPVGLVLCTYSSNSPLSDLDLTGLHVVDIILFIIVFTAEALTSYASRN